MATMARLLQRQRLYRRLFVATALVAVGLAGLALWQRGRLAVRESADTRRVADLEEVRRAANLGNRAREQAEDLAAFMLDDLRGQLQPLGRTDILADASRRTLEYFENLPPELVTPATLEARASILGTLGGVRQARGELDESAARWREAIALFGQLREMEPSQPGRTADLAATHNALALVLVEAGAIAEARQENLAALALLDEMPDAPELVKVRADTCFGLGECERATGNPEGAIAYYRQAISTLGEPDSDDIGALQTLSTAHNNIGFCEMDWGDQAAAAESYRESLTYARRLLELQPEERHWQREVATLLNNLGTVYDELGELDLARPYFAEALELRASLVAWDPANSAWQLHLANSLRNLASLELSAGDPEAAIEPVRRSLGILLDLLAREPDNTTWLELLQAEVRRFGDRFREAEMPELARDLADSTRGRLEQISRDGGAVDSAAWNQFLSKIYNDLGAAEDADGAEVVAVRLRSTTLRAENVDERPEDPEAIYQLACGYIDLAGDLLGAEREADALLAFRLARFLLESRVPPRFYRREGLIDLCLREETRLDPPEEIRELVPRDAVWKYEDGRTFPGEGWVEPGFDDSGWKSGPAELGYGDGDEATLLAYGPDPDHKNLTAWFRHAFEIDDPATFDPLRISLLCDDGARVFLNGREIIRHGLPDGSISPTTLSNRTIAGLDETLYRVFTFRAAGLPLRSGSNQLAVEVHQNEGRSSDLSFALEILARAPTPSPLEKIELSEAGTLLGEALPKVVEEWAAGVEAP